ncbi:asparagine synthetase AsnA [Vibrio ichthyoenteri ATCC 700023]|uniref:Aspartate--ammonia ligase n=1 Tax=Vibrio ichthyoenteri ATCC 700023 TaxID=870968 RepID=F9S8F3_9VIBR|nr:aspartate--ammonia ligase [Vibrio ichthyoenteri]EGU29978.1 asparagine synthetase AsnA [Vibrio ichthyoenteri ATCC 700023]
MKLQIPQDYQPLLELRDTEVAIKKLKDYFEYALAYELYLTRVSAPLFVKPETGLNDNLNGTERPVSFDLLDDNGAHVEVVHSLAKWKRMALGRYGFQKDEGLYTDMNAIRRDEELDNIHSIYVDQWDWEKVLEKSMRNEEYLRTTVEKIYNAFLKTENYIYQEYPVLERRLPAKVTFITSQELLDRYPDLSSKERENAICKEHGAVFIRNIGHALSDGERHDGRAPDYDDWNLNGDLLFWNSVLDSALELSSMGIRVCEQSLAEQLAISGCEDRASLPFHSMVLDKSLPYTIGGGIGQSRICMFFLQKAHIGEVQSSIWPDAMIAECEENKIQLL